MQVAVNAQPPPGAADGSQLQSIFVTLTTNHPKDDSMTSLYMIDAVVQVIRSGPASPT